MKLRTFCCSAVLFCIAHTLAFAQSITLDSLWGRFVGGMNTMSFSPDSKHLLIADDTGGVKVLNALTGEEVYYFTPQYGCVDMKFSPDGTRLYMASSGGMEIRDAKTYQSIDTMKFIKPHGGGFAGFDVSNDGTHIVFKTGYGGMNEDYYEMIVYSYPERKIVWIKDVVSYSVPLKIRYEGGKVVFSNDGNYILGLNTTSLCKWDWRDSTKPADVLINNLPNLELISFSPDRNYFVLKSNYIYSIPEKKLLEINGLKHDTPQYGFGSAYTQSSNIAIVTYDYRPHFVNLNQKSVFHFTYFPFASNVALSKDSSFIACQLGSDGVHMHRINWNTTDVPDNDIKSFKINVTPLPSNEQSKVTVESTKLVLNSIISITNEQGIELQTLHTGNLEIGESVFSIDNQTLPSGTYFLQLNIGTQRITKQFIITK